MWIAGQIIEASLAGRRRLRISGVDRFSCGSLLPLRWNGTLPLSCAAGLDGLPWRGTVGAGLAAFHACFLCSAESHLIGSSVFTVFEVTVTSNRFLIIDF
jgi:hypothetical protein